MDDSLLSSKFSVAEADSPHKKRRRAAYERKTARNIFIILYFCALRQYISEFCTVFACKNGDVHKKSRVKSCGISIEIRVRICYISIRKGESDVQMKDPAAHGMCIAGAGAANQNM